MVPTADRFFERDHPLARWARTAASRFPTILAAEAPDAEASAEAAPAEDPRESSGEISRSEVASALEKKPSEERSGGPAAAPPPAGRDGGPESAFSSPKISTR
jgi:hypothetical protein